jgi:hypothetical protein
MGGLPGGGALMIRRHFAGLVGMIAGLVRRGRKPAPLRVPADMRWMEPGKPKVRRTRARSSDLSLKQRRHRKVRRLMARESRRRNRR